MNRTTRWITGAVAVPIVAAVIAQISATFFDMSLTDDENNVDPEPLLPGYDFVNKASSARWRNAEELLPFPGDLGDKEGYAYFGSYDDRPFEDGSTPKRYLATHPQWVNHGIIQGRYGPFSIHRKLCFVATVGYMKNPPGSDGVEFSVIFRPIDKSEKNTLGNVKSRMDRQLDKLVVDFEKIYGKVGYIILQAYAGETSSQDWAAWKDATVVPKNGGCHP